MLSAPTLHSTPSPQKPRRKPVNYDNSSPTSSNPSPSPPVSTPPSSTQISVPTVTVTRTPSAIISNTDTRQSNPFKSHLTVVNPSREAADVKASSVPVAVDGDLSSVENVILRKSSGVKTVRCDDHAVFLRIWLAFLCN